MPNFTMEDGTILPVGVTDVRDLPGADVALDRIKTNDAAGPITMADHLFWLVTFTGTPSSTFTLTWGALSATGAITYSGTASTLVTNIQNALNAAYGTGWFTVTNATIGALPMVLIQANAAALPGRILSGTNPTGGTTIIAARLKVGAGTLRNLAFTTGATGTVTLIDGNDPSLPSASNGRNLTVLTNPATGNQFAFNWNFNLGLLVRYSATTFDATYGVV